MECVRSCTVCVYHRLQRNAQSIQNGVEWTARTDSTTRWRWSGVSFDVTGRVPNDNNAKARALTSIATHNAFLKRPKAHVTEPHSSRHVDRPEVEGSL